MRIFFSVLSGLFFLQLNAQVLNETFDTDADFVTSTSFFSDGNGDYFGLAGGVDQFGGDPTLTGLKNYTGFTGGFLTGMDLDGEGAALPITIDWTGLDITSLSSLIFSGEFAEFFDASGHIDVTDFILVEYQIDGGGYQNLLAFEGADFSSGTINGVFREDTDFDGEGDGILLTDTAILFTKAIVGTGTSLDLRVSIHVNTGNEDFGIDSFVITGSTVPDTTPPIITCPSNIIIDTDAGTCQAVVAFADATAIDNVDPHPVVTQTMGLLSGEAFPLGDTTIEFTATDAAGNMSMCMFVVTVVDAQSPIVNCPEDQTSMADQMQSYIIPDYVGIGLATAIDNCTTTLAIIQSPSPGTVVGPGMTTVVIIAEDDTGNEAFCAFNLIVEEAVLAVDGFSLNEVSMYPNPANDRVNINVSVKAIEVYNLKGQLVLKVRQNVFDASRFETGMYLVKITTEAGLVTRQLIVR